jgi:HEAT repeat protein
MKISRKHFVVASIIGVVVIVLVVKHRTTSARQEPSYQGKSLTKWLKQLDDGEAFGISSGGIASHTPAQLEAAEAIRRMASDSLPLLMKDIHTSPDPESFLMKLQDRVNRLTMRVAGRRFSFTDVTEEDRIRWRAAQGLAALGPLAKSAIPELERLLFTNYFHSSIKEAAYALATMGPQGIAILTNAVQPGEEWSGMCAIWALGQHPEAGTKAIPFLISATSSASEGTACGAIQVLGMLRADREHVIPALTNALLSRNLSVHTDAVRALGRFGVKAGSDEPLQQ